MVVSYSMFFIGIAHEKRHWQGQLFSAKVCKLHHGWGLILKGELREWATGSGPRPRVPEARLPISDVVLRVLAGAPSLGSTSWGPRARVHKALLPISDLALRVSATAP